MHKLQPAGSLTMNKQMGRPVYTSSSALDWQCPPPPHTHPGRRQETGCCLGVRGLGPSLKRPCERASRDSCVSLGVELYPGGHSSWLTGGLIIFSSSFLLPRKSSAKTNTDFLAPRARDLGDPLESTGNPFSSLPAFFPSLSP